MSRFVLALLLSAALLPCPRAEEGGAARRTPPRSRYPPTRSSRRQTASQYLAREQLIGAKVVNKDGQPVGTIDDLIVGSGDKIEGVILGVGGLLGVGEKEIGVRLGALKVSTADGKVSVTFPAATKEMLACGRRPTSAGGAPAKR